MTMAVMEGAVRSDFESRGIARSALLSSITSQFRTC
jgi:hypothetical protein